MCKLSCLSTHQSKFSGTLSLVRGHLSAAGRPSVSWSSGPTMSHDRLGKVFLVPYLTSRSAENFERE